MVANSRRPSALLALVLLLTVTIAHSAIDSRSPSVARGIIGDPVQLACATTSYEHAVSWKRLRDNQILSVKGRISVDDPRFSVSSNGYEHTWFLNIEDSTQRDEGEYLCTVGTHSERAEKKVRLTLVEPSDTIRWRSDHKCDDLVECDPLGAYPCCSASGWCGFTRLHCECASCVDYRLQPIETTTPAPTSMETTTPAPASKIPQCTDGYVEVAGKCLLYADDVQTWSQATHLCASKQGHLITFETLDQLMEVVENLTKLQTTKIVALSPRVPVWVGISTRGHKDSNGTLRWRWVIGQSELKDTSLLKHLDKADGERCGFFDADHPIATIRHTSDCEEVKLPLCEQGQN